ncbi:hypothetical protein [uncultured Gordonia sp.]|uniref:hypothetical protein n=1 Tax=uncultured Gordonia sp. TaxID=198437 RepID=UPI00260F66DC|nr:hypothetical protein [uncultured Gordonia sp.]
MTDFYRTIGLDPSAPPQVLADQISALAHRTPPGPDRAYLEQAWATLGVPDRKAAYDAWLSGGGADRSAVGQFAEYVRRFVGIGDVSLSPAESAALDRAGVTSTGARSMLAWRRAALVLLLPFLLVYVALSFYSTFGGDDSGLTPLGMIVSRFPSVTMALATIAVVVVVIKWTEQHWTGRVLFWTWLAATSVPLVSFVLPIDWYFDLPDYDPSTGLSRADLISLARPVWTVAVAVTVLPVTVSLVSGILRGVRRVKGLLPASTLPGWFLSVIAPFSAAILLAIYSILAPVLDDRLAMTGALLLVAAPVVFLIFRGRYLAPMTHTDASRALRAPSLVAAICTLAGAVLLVVYALTGEVLGRVILGDPDAVAAQQAWQSYVDLPALALEVFVRFSLTSVVMVGTFVAVIRGDWKLNASMTGQVRAERDAEMVGPDRAPG